MKRKYVYRNGKMVEKNGPEDDQPDNNVIRMFSVDPIGSDPSQWNYHIHPNYEEVFWQNVPHIPAGPRPEGELELEPGTKNWLLDKKRQTRQKANPKLDHTKPYMGINGVGGLDCRPWEEKVQKARRLTVLNETVPKPVSRWEEPLCNVQVEAIRIKTPRAYSILKSQEVRETSRNTFCVVVRPVSILRNQI